MKRWDPAEAGLFYTLPWIVQGIKRRCTLVSNQSYNQYQLRVSRRPSSNTVGVDGIRFFLTHSLAKQAEREVAG